MFLQLTLLTAFALVALDRTHYVYVYVLWETKPSQIPRDLDDIRA